MWIILKEWNNRTFEGLEWSTVDIKMIFYALYMIGWLLWPFFLYFAGFSWLLYFLLIYDAALVHNPCTCRHLFFLFFFPFLFYFRSAKSLVAQLAPPSVSKGDVHPLSSIETIELSKNRKRNFEAIQCWHHTYQMKKVVNQFSMGQTEARTNGKGC